MSLEYHESVKRDTTQDFLRSFSAVSEEDAADYDMLSPYPEDYPDMPSLRIAPEENIQPVVPFLSIHKLSLAFDSNERRCWIPGHPVQVKITHFDRQAHRKRLNPNLYTIDVTHDEFHWTIRRRYKHFNHLHTELTNFRRLYSIPIPTRGHRQMRQSMRGKKKEVSKFPTRIEALVREEDLPKRMEQLENYLNTMLKCNYYKNHHETVKFFGVSHLSFVRHLGIKGWESMVKKCSGGRRINVGCCGCCQQFHLCGRWSKRWMLIKDTFMAYLDPDTGRICDVMLMDHAFHVECGLEQTGARHGLLITNLSRHLLLKCWTHRKAREWMQHLEDVATTSGKDFTKGNRFGGYAPPREDSYARWFIDGASYFAAVAEALEMAKEEIFITDWWLSPEVYLKRPVTEGDKWELDMVLKRKAELGVKVFILLYKEVEMALGLNSAYSKVKLCKHNENIKVLRHPDHVTKGVLLWAHHEKIVVIDQRIAFVGGIDLCYGRWDDDQHRLTDLGSVVFDSSAHSDSPKQVSNSTFYAAGDASNRKAVKFQSVDEVDARWDKNRNSESGHENLPSEGEVTVVIHPPDENRHSHSQIDSADSADVGGGGDSSSHKTQHPPLKASDSYDRELSKESQESEKSVTSKSSETAERKDEERKLKIKVLSRFKHNFFSRTIANEHKSEETIESALDDEGGFATHPSYDRAISKESGESKMSESGNPSKLKLKFMRTKGDDHKHHKVRESAPGDLQKGDLDEVDSRGKFRALVHAVKASRSTKRWAKTSDMVEVPKDLFFRPPSSKPQRRKLIQNFRDKVAQHRRGRRYDIDDKYAPTLELPPEDLYRTMSQQEFDELGLAGATKLWIGKDYVNFIFKDFENLDQPFTDFIDRTKTPRMPWHDISSVVYGKAARDVARHFIGRWNTVKLEKAKYSSKYPFLLPKSYHGMNVHHSIKDITFGTQCQILRSCGKWSAGLSEVETSIHQAYIDSINNAKHFIYIENQFFISPIDHPDVKNEIGKALLNRILKAYHGGEKFRVYVVMPLLPGFEGAFGTPTGAAIQAITHWNYMSTCRGPHAILSKLAKEVPDPLQYISFYGLRTHNELMGELVTELVYVHSKLMIVDDTKVIIGSANINDRSMLGNRDSEMAILVEDTHKFTVQWNGTDHEAGYFASSLRRTLFREHLGIAVMDSNIDVSDPLSDSFYKEIWIKQASVNTFIFEKVFNCIPTDSVLTFPDLHQYMQKPTLAKDNPTESRELLKRAKGHIVLMPASFLCRENLAPPPGTKEALMPVSLWT